MVSCGRERWLSTKLWCKAGEWIYPLSISVKSSEAVLLALPDGSKLPLVVLTNRHGEKEAFERVVVAYQVPGDFKQWNHIWESIAISHHGVKFTVIHCHFLRSLCFLYRPNRQVEWGCGGNYHSTSFKFSMVALKSLQKCSIGFGLLFSSVEVVLVASTCLFYNNPDSTGQGTNVGILLTAEYIPIFLSRTGWNNHRMD